MAAGKVRELWEEAVHLTRERPRRSRGRKRQEEQPKEEKRQFKRNVERARTLAQDG